MHKDFYASGFIYHPPSEKILLQQTIAIPPVSSPWLLFEENYSEKDDPAVLFKKMISDLLNIELAEVYPVYSYFNENKKRNQSIIYSSVTNMVDFTPKNGMNFAWFTFKEVLKLQVTEQTKHDIVVGQRVIEAAIRKSLGLHTFQ